MSRSWGHCGQAMIMLPQCAKMDYKVYKYIRHEPTVFGLNYSSARIFGAVGIVGLMAMLSGFTFLKVSIIALCLFLLHLVLMSLQGRKPNANLPGVIINESWHKRKH